MTLTAIEQAKQQPGALWNTAMIKENRLTESGNLGMSESVKYTYDANGNLLRESAARYRKDFVYNAQNRMSFSDVQDSVLNTRNFTEYAYDAFGRPNYSSLSYF